jgi:hypothetical protein
MSCLCTMRESCWECNPRLKKPGRKPGQKARQYLTKKEIVKRVLKSKLNTIFVNEAQVERTLQILSRMKVLKARD